MEWLWAAQVTVNFLFLVGMIFWWTERRGQKTRLLENQLRRSLSQVEEKAAFLTSQSEQIRKRMDEHFSMLYTVSNQAQQLLQRGREEMEKRIPTLEEQDLLGLPAPAPSEEELDKGIKTHPDAPLGLKAVLREQLF